LSVLFFFYEILIKNSLFQLKTNKDVVLFFFFVGVQTNDMKIFST